MKKLTIVAAILLTVPFLALAQPTAQDIHKLGIITVPQVIEVYNQAIDGNAYAQADIGQSLINGSIGVLPNYEKALYWFNKSAKQGEPLAYLNLAMLYLSGNGVRPNVALAKKYAKLGLDGYYKKVKNNKYSKYQKAEVEYLVANIYFWGVPDVVDQNLQKAAAMFLESADAGFTHSIRAISQIYFHGIGVTKDQIKGHDWAMRLAINNDPHAEYIVGLNFLKGQGVQKNVQTGLMWLRKASTAHYPPADVVLYKLYKQGVAKLTPLKQKTFENIMQQSGDNVLEVLTRSPQARF